MKKFFSPLLMALLLCGAGCAQTLLHPQFKPAPIPEEQVVAARSLSWVNKANKAWTGDNKPYSQIRASIDTDIAKGQPVDNLRQQYGLVAQQKPDDPLAQFAWAYAARIASQSRTITSGKSYDDLWDVPEAMAHVPDPHTYDFYRLRFLLTGDKTLLPFANRLLSVDPNDIDVKVQIVNVYCTILHSYWIYPKISPEVKSIAIADCRRLIEAYPQNPRYYALLGSVYLASWDRSHDEEDRKSVIAACNQFLRMSPPTDKRLGNAQYLLKLLSKPAKSG